MFCCIVNKNGDVGEAASDLVTTAAERFEEGIWRYGCSEDPSKRVAPID